MKGNLKSSMIVKTIWQTKWIFATGSENWVVTFHSLLLSCCKITRYSLQSSLVTRCRSCSLQKITRYSLQKLLVAKNYSLLVAKFAHYSVQKLLIEKSQSLVVAKFARYSLQKITRYSLQKQKWKENFRMSQLSFYILCEELRAYRHS